MSRLARSPLPVLALWAASALVLSALTGRVRDWFVMTNELLYERRAISAALDLSPLPRLHGDYIPSFDQLYPLLVAPAFHAGAVASDVHQAHVLNAWIMTSACIPAFLVARRVLPLWGAYAAAVFSVLLPWMVYASFLLTEVAAYPAFLWALLAMQRAAAAPSARRDLVAVAAIGLAFLARTQLAVLALVLPVALLAHERGFRATLREHRLLARLYAFGILLAIVLMALGRLSSVLGVYGDTIHGNLLPSGTLGAFVEHLATFSLGLGILPFLVGTAWLLANLWRAPAAPEVRAFASVGAVTLVAMAAEVTIFDVRFGGAGGFVHDRYLFYVAPVVLLGFLCALADARLPAWSLVAPVVLVALGFSTGALPRFTWQQFRTLNSDTPVSALYRPLADWFASLTGARVALVVATVVLAALFVEGAILLRRTHLVTVLVVLTTAALASITAFVFVQLFDTNGWASRPLTNPQPQAFAWVDDTVGQRSHVAIVPYPVSSAYLVNQRVWRDYEFWNKSVDRVVQYRNPFAFRFTGDTFPKLMPRFDAKTGASSISPARWALQANQETRFRLAGNVRAQKPDVLLVDAGERWRADWVSSGLTDDGWTKPGVEGRVRVFATPGQRGRVTRFLTFGVRPPEGVNRRRFRITSNRADWRGEATYKNTVFKSVPVCVPAGRFADVRVATPESSAIGGDLGDLELSMLERRGGIFLSEIALSDDVGDAC